jgi:hypothetical protein
MSNIPEARERLKTLIGYIEEGAFDENPKNIVSVLTKIEALLYRKSPIRKAEPHSQPMTPELAAAIRAFANRNHNMPFQAIGQRFNVNAGRVTEVLQGEHLE